MAVEVPIKVGDSAKSEMSFDSTRRFAKRIVLLRSG